MRLARSLIGPVLLISMFVGSSCRDSDRVEMIRIATTTSVENSGLLADLLPRFRQETGLEVQALAVGSGRALNLARRGDVDAVITHDPTAERIFIDEGHSTLYRKIMYNEFVIAGPSIDPAQIGESATTGESMRRIAEGRVPFASRGDDSGTHTRERTLWADVGINPEREWYLEAGQGMAGTLRIASERRAYVLTDRATLAQLGESVDLEILHEGGVEMLNTYSVMVAADGDPSRIEAAKKLAVWLANGSGRAAIDAYRIRGSQAFIPWPEETPRENPEDLPEEE